MKHISTPWSVEAPMDQEFAIVQSGLEAYEWQFIAVCPVGTPAEGAFSRQRAKINADFIVKACNAHEALVAAIREACDLLAERTYGNAARSPGHNARLCLEGALKSVGLTGSVASADGGAAT